MLGRITFITHNRWVCTLRHAQNTANAHFMLCTNTYEQEDVLVSPVRRPLVGQKAEQQLMLLLSASPLAPRPKQAKGDSRRNTSGINGPGDYYLDDTLDYSLGSNVGCGFGNNAGYSFDNNEGCGSGDQNMRRGMLRGRERGMAAAGRRAVNGNGSLARRTFVEEPHLTDGEDQRVGSTVVLPQTKALMDGGTGDGEKASGKRGGEAEGNGKQSFSFGRRCQPRVLLRGKHVRAQSHIVVRQQYNASALNQEPAEMRELVLKRDIRLRRQKEKDERELQRQHQREREKLTRQEKEQADESCGGPSSSRSSKSGGAVTAAVEAAAALAGMRTGSPVTPWTHPTSSTL
jgi:hypothetical protein